MRHGAAAGAPRAARPPSRRVGHAGSATDAGVGLGALVGRQREATRLPIEERFASFRSLALLHDSAEPTRQMLGRHAALRLLAPWVQENPLQLHLSNASPSAFDLAREQVAEIGFEAIVLSFGSGFRFELEPGDPYIGTLRALVDKE